MSAVEARGAIEHFFAGFNARNQEAIRAALHYPHVRIASGRVAIAHNASEFRIPFDALIAAEGWHHSTLDAAAVVHEGPDKVHFDVRFSRHRKDGTRYATHTALWIVTRENGRWGLQARSSFAP